MKKPAKMMKEAIDKFAKKDKRDDKRMVDKAMKMKKGRK